MVLALRGTTKIDATRYRHAMDEIEPEIQPGTPSVTDAGDQHRARARKRLNDASARVSAEARIESREQVREIMGWHD